jgi:RNA polymerase sigma-70 factor (ECF subfamily)
MAAKPGPRTKDHRQAAGWVFPTTPWALVVRSRDPNESVRLEALGQLLTLYRGPILRHLVLRHRAKEEDAEDWFQGFVAEKVLMKGLLQRAEQGRGRFRSMVLTALDNYVRDLHRQAQAAKRRPPGGWVALDELAPDERESLAAEPGRSVVSAWAQVVIAITLERMEAECRAKDASLRWQVFKLRRLDPILDGTPAVSYAELIRRLPVIESPTQASNLLVTANRMFERTLREVIGEYERDQRDIDEERQELVAALS